MKLVKIEIGDLLNCEDEVIVQQCNCTTLTSMGLCAAIEGRYNVKPYSKRARERGNIATKETCSKPGTISVHEIENNTRVVICLYAQWAPGKCDSRQHRFWKDMAKKRNVEETPKIREQWFKTCLEEMRKEIIERELYSIAFPYGIGCGLAGGEWDTYYHMIEEWVQQNPEISARVIKMQ